MTDLPVSVLVDEKYDGFRCILTRVGDKVSIVSEEGTDFTDRFPSLVKELKGWDWDVILDSEVTGWAEGFRKGDHLGRSTVAGYANSKEPPDDSRFYANVFDIVWYDKNDIHNEPLSVRREHLNKKPTGEHIKIADYKICEAEKELVDAIKHFSKMPGSEGAMIKSLESNYPLTGSQPRWIKFKKEVDLDAEVIDIHAVKDSPGVFNYLCVIRDDQGQPIPVGKSYNAKFEDSEGKAVEVPIGGIIRVAFVNLNKYTDPKTGEVWFNWWAPRAIEYREDKKNPDNIQTALRIVDSTKGEIGEKPYPKRYRDIVQELGGPTSGHRGHKGVPGMRGGSAPSVIYAGDVSAYPEAPIPKPPKGDLRRYLEGPGDFVEVYHTTDPDYLASIANSGLIPALEKPFGQTWEAEHSKYATYFFSDPEPPVKDIREFGYMLVIGRLPREKEFASRIIPDEDVSLNPNDGLKALNNTESVAIIAGLEPELISGFVVSPNLEIPDSLLQSLMDRGMVIWDYDWWAEVSGVSFEERLEECESVREWITLVRTRYDISRDELIGALLEEPHSENLSEKILVELAARNPSALPKNWAVFQLHCIGAGAHLDFRRKQNDHLKGDTLFAWPEGAAKEPIDTLEACRLSLKDVPLKFSPDMDPTKHCLGVSKAQQPIEWLVIAPKVFPPGQVGASAEEKGVFCLFDEGMAYPGTQKPYFKEWFLDMKKFKGRMVARQLPSGKYERVGKGPTHWEYWTNMTDQTPYILTLRGRRRKDYVPPDGESALPPEWEKKIPKEFQWWVKGQARGERLERMDLAFNHLVEEGVLKHRPIELATANWSMRKMWWEGPKHVRGMPIEHWNLLIERDSEVEEFYFDESPFFEPEQSVTRRMIGYAPPEGDSPKDWLSWEGELPASHRDNPNKELPVHVEIEDSGTLDIIEDSPNFLHLRFRGKLMKGLHVVKREEPGSDIWVFQPGRLPGEERKV